mmetsp:Transcript_143934/g.460730  ORF Transcript_143934/g.460730 Transcript_143934/m.460730 type:complete len:510 (-) Transcript_143934:81-1610(-)
MAAMRHAMSDSGSLSSSPGTGGGFAAGAQRPNGYQQQYQTLMPSVRHVLEVILENDSEESIVAVTHFVIGFRFENGTDITQWMPPVCADIVLKGRMLEAICHWIRGKTKELDAMIPIAQVGIKFVAERAMALRAELQQAMYTSQPWEPLVAEFVNMVVFQLLGAEASVLGSALGGSLVAGEDRETILFMVEYPSMMLAWMVRKLEEILGKSAKVIMEVYNDTIMTYHDSKERLMMFFQHYTVETGTGSLEVHDTCTDEVFQDSLFRVNLIDSFGNLMKLLTHFEDICNTMAITLAVDFEGVKLCRHGALCLVQITCSDDPRLVYVLDVHVLGKRAFSLKTPGGLCMKAVLEDMQISKVWFDPRNDVDALYHQFGIMPQGIFDLQLAEVASRRNQGFNVKFVSGLYKCLTQCPELEQEQKVFAGKINDLGKRLFEPRDGGCYEIFQQRPLNPVILVYAAHDSRYMLVLYQQYAAAIGDAWIQRVMQAGQERGRWCLSREYTVPSSEAPDF